MKKLKIRHQLFYRGKKGNMLLQEHFTHFNITPEEFKKPINQISIVNYEKENIIDPNIFVKRHVIESKEEYNELLQLSNNRKSREDELLELLIECRNKLEYLNEKFKETGTTNSLLTKLNNEIDKNG